MSISTAELLVSSHRGVRVGFIGIGNMGWHMARNVMKKMDKDSRMAICDIDSSRVDEMIAYAAGIAPDRVDSASTPREVVEKADVIITSLPAARHVLEVFSHPETGLLASVGQRQKLFLETSTIEVSASSEIAALVKESGIGDIIDSPVSGGPDAAELGTLSIMAGGDFKTFQKVLPILNFMGKPENIFYCGSQGAGLATKQLNNYAANVNFLGLCEAMNTGIRYGLDPIVLGNVINASSGMSWNSLNQNPVKGVNSKSSASRDFEGGFPTELCLGVIKMAIQLAKQVDAKMIAGPVLLKLFEEAVNDPKCQGKECRSIYRLIAED